MSLDINMFRNAAACAASRVVLQKEHAVTGESGLNRLFCWCRTTPSAKMANRETALAFRRALVAEYGERIAAGAFTPTIGVRDIQRGQAVSSRQISVVLRAADTLRDQASAILGSQFAVPGLGETALDAPPLENTLRFARLSNIEQTVLNLTRQGLSQTTDLLAEVPVSPESHENFSAKAADLRGTLARLLDEAHTLSDTPVTEEIKTELAAALGDIAAKTAEVERLRARHPFSAEHVFQAREQWFNAALLYLDKNLEALLGSIPDEYTAPMFTAKIRILEMRETDRLRFSTSQELVARPEQELRGLSHDLEKIVHGCFQGRRSKAEVRLKLKQAWSETINTRQPWNTMTRTAPLVLNGQRLSPTCTITPAGKLGNIFQDAYRGTGVGCYSFSEAGHAVNLAASALTLPNAYGGEKNIFSGLRHAAHCAAGIGDPEARRAANLVRATETLTAALLHRPELLKTALERAAEDPHNAEPVHVPLVSVSLLTPDMLRNSGFLNFFKDMRFINERRMLREQKEAWDTLGATPVHLTVLDPQGRERKITVQADVATFNFGVNAGALNLPHLPDLAGGWDMSDSMNLRAMTQLERRVDQFLASDGPERDKQLAGQLFGQIQELWRDESYKRPGREPYKIASRIALLTFMLGETPVWNCKSGKDRTGNLDVEARFLALRTAVEGKVPPPDAPLDAEQSAALRALALGSCNHELQTLNTGLPGFKLEGVQATDVRLGDVEGREYFRGASPFTAS